MSSHTTRHPPPRHLTPPATRHPVISHHPPPRHLTPPATRHPVILHHPPLRQLSCPSFNSQPKAGWVQAAMVLHALRGRQAAWPHLPLSPHHLAAARPGCLPWLQVLATFTSSSAHTDGIRPVSDSVQACPPCQSTMPCHHALPCPALPPLPATVSTCTHSRPALLPLPATVSTCTHSRPAHTTCRWPRPSPALQPPPLAPFHSRESLPSTHRWPPPLCCASLTSPQRRRCDMGPRHPDMAPAHA